MICKIKGCERKAKKRGWCIKHYTCWWKYGDPLFTKHHGYYKHPLYQVWQQMKERCYNKNNLGYEYYGGREIVMCDEWMNPKVFIEWGKDNGWEKGLQIDRRDNDGNYCSENCRFVTHTENMHNTRLLYKNNTSGYRGVASDHKKWRAQICINSKMKHLGCFNTPEEAALAYDRAIPDERPRNFK